jgi:hypothetical protein
MKGNSLTQANVPPKAKNKPIKEFSYRPQELDSGSQVSELCE